MRLLRSKRGSCTGSYVAEVEPLGLFAGRENGGHDMPYIRDDAAEESRREKCAPSENVNFGRNRESKMHRASLLRVYLILRTHAFAVAVRLRDAGCAHCWEREHGSGGATLLIDAYHSPTQRAGVSPV